MTQNYLDNCQNSPDLQLKSSIFIWKRKLTLKRMLIILLQQLVCSLQLGLDRFFGHLEEETVNKQEFPKARASLNLKYVRKIANEIANIPAQDTDTPPYCGMRLMAIDGTGIALESSAELKYRYQKS